MGAAEQKYDSFSDLPALEAEKAKIVAMFKEVKDGVLELKNLGVSLNTSKSVKEVANLTDEVEKQEKALTNQQKTLVKMAGALAALTTEEAKQIEGMKAATSIVKGLNAEEIKTQKLRAGEYAQLQAAKIQNNELNKSIQLRLKIQQSEKGSEQQLILLRDKANGILKKLSATQRESTRGQALQKFAKDTNDQINSIQQKVGNFKNNVGNYANSLTDGFEKVRREIARLNTEAQKMEANNDPAGAVKVRQSIEELDRVLKISFNGNQSYSKSVKQVEKAYQDLAQGGNQSNEFLQEFKKFAAESKDQAADLREEIKALSSDTHGLDQVVGAISTVASGFEAASGFAALFGADASAVEKSIQKLVAIQSIANGVREVGEQITKRGTLANKAYNFVIQQGTVLFGKGSTAAQRFGAALKGIVIFAIVGFIIQLVQNLDLFSDSSKDAAERTKELNDELKELNDTIKEQIGLIGQADQDNLRLLKSELSAAEARGASARELFAIRKKIAAEELKIADDQINAVIKRAEAEDVNFTAAEGSVKGEQALINARNEYNRLYKQSLDELQKLQEKKLHILNLGGGESETEKVQKEIDAEKSRKDLYKQRYDDYTNIAQALLDAQDNFDNQQAAETKRVNDAEKKAAFELFKFRANLQKEENDFKASDEGIFSVQAKIQAAQKSADIEKSVIQATRKFELSQADLAASAIQQINEEADEKLINLKIQTSNKIANIRIKDLQRIRDEAEAGAAYFFEEQKMKLEAEQEFQEKQLARQQTGFANERDLALQRVTATYQDELKLAGGNQEKILAAEKKFANYKKKIEMDYQISILNSQIIFYQQQLKLLKDNGLDTTDTIAALNKAKADLAALGVESTMEEIEALDALKQKYEELRNTVEDTIVSAINGLYDAQKRRIDERIEDIDKLKAAEIDRVNASTDSEEKKAAKVKLIEAQAQNRKEALERKQRQIDRQKAIFERSTKVFDLVTDNIKAVNKIKLEALAAVNPVVKGLLLAQIPLVIATGAASLVALLAQPLPKYARGTDSSVGGLAEVAEEGREIGIEPGGRVKVWNRRQITNLVKGTRILPNSVTEKVIAASGSRGMMVQADGQLVDSMPDLDRLHSTQEDMLNELVAIRKKPGITLHNELNIESTVWWDKNMKH